MNSPPPNLKRPFFASSLSVVEPFLDLDHLWHYECVVSPRASSSAKLSPKSVQNSTPIPCPNQFPTSSPSPDAFPATTSLSKSAEKSTSQPSSSSLHSIYQAPRSLLHRVFATLDENHDGRISTDEFGRFFQKFGISKTERDIHSLLNSTTLREEGHVDKQEFVLLYESACSFLEQLDEENKEVDIDRDVREAFRAFDKDDDGFITPTELQSVLCSLGFPQELEDCVKMIQRVDENGDGQVDFFEFKKMMSFGEQIIVSY